MKMSNAYFLCISNKKKKLLLTLNIRHEHHVMETHMNNKKNEHIDYCVHVPNYIDIFQIGRQMNEVAFHTSPICHLLSRFNTIMRDPQT